MKRLSFGLLICLLELASATSVWAAWGGPISVTTARVRREMVGQTIYVTGDLMAARRTTVGTEETGRVATVHIDEGTVVKAGEPLIELDDQLLRLHVERDQASLAAAQAELDRLAAGSRNQEIAMARARVSARSAELDTARVNYQSQRSLRQEGVVSTTEYTGTEASFHAAEAQLREAQSDLDLALAGSRSEEIAAQRAKVAEAQADLGLSQQALERSVVRAPFDSVVSQQIAEVGAWLRVGDPVAELLETNALEAVVDVPEHQVPMVGVNQSAEVTVDAYPGRSFAGRVTAIVPDANLTNRTYPVHVRIENMDGQLRAGMFGRVALATSSPSPALLMPADALVDRGRGAEVWQVVPGLDATIAQPVRVTVGRRRGTDIEVMTGLNASAEVVIAGNENLYPGAAVATGGAPPMGPGGPGGGPGGAEGQAAAGTSSEEHAAQGGDGT